MLAIGVDLGGTHLRAAVVDTASPDGDLLAERHLDLGDPRQPVAVAEQLCAVVRELAGRGLAGGQPGGVTPGIAGAGIGIAAMLRGSTGVVANAPNLGWREVDFRGLLRSRLDLPVELYNDLNAIAWGEHRYGAGRGAADILCVYLGSGIGGGLVMGGRLQLGATNTAGEIGHLKLVPGGRPCGCGARGCLEAYAGGHNLARRMREELAARENARTASGPAGRQVGGAGAAGRDGPNQGAAGAGNLALELAGGDLEALHPGHLDQAARAGDGWALAIIDEVAGLCGRVLANAVTLLNPGRLVLGGGVWEGCPLLRQRVLEALRLFGNPPSMETLEVVSTALGNRAGVLGAAALVAEMAAAGTTVAETPPAQAALPRLAQDAFSP